MTILAILKRFNFCLNNTSESDMTMSSGSWFKVLIVWNEKTFTLIKVPGGMRLLK